MIVFPKIIKWQASTAIVTWADGTAEELAAMLAANDAGSIDITDYWSVGDERTVHLDAMTAGDSFTTAMDAQDVVLVLMDTGTVSGYKDVNDKTVNFVVGQKDYLNQGGRMNTTDTNAGSWNGCAMRADLNNKYYNALSAEFRACLKQFKTITAQTYNGSTNQTSQDYISLFAEKEVFGNLYYDSNPDERAALKQINYYTVAANRVKDSKGKNYDYWSRSPYPSDAGYFVILYKSGSRSSINRASNVRGIAPFMCV